LTITLPSSELTGKTPIAGQKQIGLCHNFLDGLELLQSFSHCSSVTFIKRHWVNGIKDILLECSDELPKRFAPQVREAIPRIGERNIILKILQH